MQSPDGVNRTQQQADELASHIAAAIKTPAGKKLVEYMKRVSTNRVMPTTGTSEALWHLEGMRHMVYLINFWKEHHDERQRSSVSGTSDGRNTPTKPKRSPARKSARNAKSAS